MSDLLRARLAPWGARLSFAAVLLVFSEGGVWQTPTQFTALEWLAWGAIYLALAAATLDLIGRFGVSDVLSVLLVAGVYGLVNGTLISHIVANDLPLSLIVRPLAAQPLAFVLALAAFVRLTGERATGLWDLLIVLGVGLVWGVWVRWFPVVSDEVIPRVAVADAVLALAVGLVACAVLRFALPAANIDDPTEWQLSWQEWVLVGGVLVAALVARTGDSEADGLAATIVVTLTAYIIMLLYVTQNLRRGPSLLVLMTPPRTPHLISWLMIVVAFLAMGWIGYELPGSGDRSVQSDLLFGALTGFGIVWLPGVSTVLGVRAFVQLSRQGY